MVPVDPLYGKLRIWASLARPEGEVAECKAGNVTSGTGGLVMGIGQQPDGSGTG